MRTMTTLALITFTLLPSVALAQGCDREKMQSVSQCAPGQTFDAATQTCVTPVSS